MRTTETNQHGDLVGLEDLGGNVTGTFAYDPWGNPTDHVGDDATNHKQRFQSQYTDQTTGLVDMNARLYDPTLGEFTAQDSVFGQTSDPTSLNQYTYGEDSPVTYADPSGNAACEDANCDITYLPGDSASARRHNHWADQQMSRLQPALDRAYMIVKVQLAVKAAAVVWRYKHADDLRDLQRAASANAANQQAGFLVNYAAGASWLGGPVPGLLTSSGAGAIDKLNNKSNRIYYSAAAGLSGDFYNSLSAAGAKRRSEWLGWICRT